VSVRHRARRALVGTAALAVVAAVALAPAAANAAEPDAKSPLNGINHIVVIYEENHSFDNLFGGWEGVNGLDQATQAKTTQVDAHGNKLACLPQNDVNLPKAPLSCTPATFPNKPFKIDDYIKPTDSTCIKPGAVPPPGVSWANGIPKGDPNSVTGGCTEDLVHRFYQEQYQINGGQQNRYVTGSDAIGLTMGHYDTKSLPIYQYLHSSDAPNYAIADDFFQAAFGGSFLNHQWLIAAQTPKWTDAATAAGKNAVVGPDGMPSNYPLHPVDPASGIHDGALTQAPEADGSCKVAICGNYAVNTVQPWYQPHFPGATDANRMPALIYDNVGDKLSEQKIDWAWYAGGWDNAAGVKGPGWTNGTGPKCSDPRTMPTAVYPNCPDVTFQFHHQPFSYFANYAPGTKARDKHLRDEVEFITAAKKGKLGSVSFVKPIGEENEHPGYASEPTGSTHLVELLKAIENGKQAEDTMVVVTYDEFGGQWDHVSPPPTADQWGPGTRIPALIISPKLPKKFAVDHTQYDTTSILATIEHRFDLPTVGKNTRDGKVNDLSAPFATEGGGGSGGGTGGGTGGSGGGGGLPITGTNVLALVIAGLVLVVGGGAAVVLGRRRRAG
jgi:acid phosphatase